MEEDVLYWRDSQSTGNSNDSIGRFISANSTLSRLHENSNKSLLEFLNENSPEYVTVVPDHWLTQEAPSTDVQIYIGISFLLICVPGNISQILVLLAYYRSRKLHTASNRLLISLLIADLILLLNCYIAVYQSLSNYPSFGVFGCQIYGFFGTISALAEIWSLTAVSIDRLQAIINPLDGHKRISKSQANVIIAFVWGLSLMFAIFPLVGWNQYVSEAYFIGCTFDSFSQSWHDRSYVLTLLVTAWLVPLFMIFLSDLGILHRIRTTNINITLERSKSLASTDSSKQDYRIDNGLNTLERKRNRPHDAKRVEMEKRLAKMVCVLLVIWALAWTPYAIMSIWIMFCDSKGLSPVYGLIPTICCKLSAGLNTLLYGIRLPKFKIEVKNMVLASLPTQISNFLTLQKPWRSYKQPDIFLSEGGSTTHGKSTEEKLTLTPWTPCHDNVQRENMPYIMKNGKSSSKDALVKKSISSPKSQSRALCRNKKKKPKDLSNVPSKKLLTSMDNKHHPQCMAKTEEPLETISLNTQDQTAKYIPPAATVINTLTTLREQEILHVQQLNLTINPLFSHCTSPSPSKEPTKYSPSVNLLIKTSSHFSMKDIAFIDEDVSENSFCMMSNAEMLHHSETIALLYSY